MNSKSLKIQSFYNLILLSIISWLGCSSVPDASNSSSASCAANALTNSVKIMPLGDSITLGFGSHDSEDLTTVCGYRCNLANSLEQTTNRPIEFVGSQINGPAENKNNHHEGHAGFLIKGWESRGTLGKGLFENLPTWLIENVPDIILLHIGVNTIAANYPTTGAGFLAQTELLELIDRIYQYVPKATIFVSNLMALNLAAIPNQNWGPTFAQEILSFNGGDAYTATPYLNGGIPEIVKSLSANGHKIYFVDLFHAGLDSSNFSDHVHPNKSGYQKIANTFYNSLKAINPRVSGCPLF